jgi:hypothetical protein
MARPDQRKGVIVTSATPISFDQANHLNATPIRFAAGRATQPERATPTAGYGKASIHVQKFIAADQRT